MTPFMVGHEFAIAKIYGWLRDGDVRRNRDGDVPESRPAYDAQQAADAEVDKMEVVIARTGRDWTRHDLHSCFMAGAKWQREANSYANIKDDPDFQVGYAAGLKDGKLESTDFHGLLGSIYSRMSLIDQHIEGVQKQVANDHGALEQQIAGEGNIREENHAELLSLVEAVHGAVARPMHDVPAPADGDGSVNISAVSDDVLEQLYRSEQLSWGRYEEELDRRAKLDGGLSAANSLIRHRDAVIRGLRAENERLRNRKPA